MRAFFGFIAIACMTRGVRGTTTVAHKVVNEEHLCYQTDYIDAGYEQEGYRYGKCPSKYNVVLQKSEETICNGNSKENIKYCPNDTIKIHVEKLGEASTLAEFQNQFYHTLSDTEHLCYQSTYIDANYRSEGWTDGMCPSGYHKIGEQRVEVCDGHSEENLKYCPDSSIWITIVKMGETAMTLSVGNPLPGELYHVESDTEHLCYETNYTDGDFEAAGWTDGACPSKFSELSRTEVTICMGHSNENLKYCPNSQLNITVLKMGVAAASLEGTTDAVAMQYHTLSDTEHLCYQSTYIDANYRSEGWTDGKCPSGYHKIGEQRVEVCDGHSEENLKYCPDSSIWITIVKMGETAMTLSVGNPLPGELYHVESDTEHLCYETNYTDGDFEAAGWTDGACPSKFSELSRTEVTICMGHSNENLKYCPNSQLNITVLKMGVAAASLEIIEESDGDDPQYHLGEVTDVTCYQTTYNDADMTARGYVSGPCDPSFDNVLSSTTSEVCDGHSNENIKYCPGKTINITIYKIGKKPSWFREAGNLCYTMDYNDDHLTNDEGYAPGICPKIYNDLLDTTTARYCKGHSEENIKYCTGPVITATIKKFGEQTPQASVMRSRSLRG